MIDKYSIFLKIKLGEKYGKIVESSSGILGLLALFKLFSFIAKPKEDARYITRSEAMHNIVHNFNSIQFFGIGLFDILIFICAGVIIWAIYKGLNSEK